MARLKKNKPLKETNIPKTTTVTVKEVKKTVNKDNLINKEQFQKGIEVLLLYDEKNQSQDLFTRDKPLFLQIEAIRIPFCPNRRMRLPLEHSLLTDKQEVCLIVPDLKRGRRIDHEPTIEHYEELLRSKNVQTIKRIIPMRQLKVEYDQFELKRRLCGYYDHFLVSGNISGHVLHLLGKTFIDKRKAPIPISLQSNNLAENIEKALKKTSLDIHDKGTSFVVQFGHTEMTVEQLLDNLVSVCEKLKESFPGGWSNIRSLHIKTDKSISIPIYYTLKNSNKVNVPVLKPLRPKNYQKVTGELTTKVNNSEVTVHPGGKIEYEKKTVGVSKNKLRKIRQGKIRKQSKRLRAKKEKLKISKDKIKSEDVQQKTVEEIKKESQKGNKNKIEKETDVNNSLSIKKTKKSAKNKIKSPTNKSKQLKPKKEATKQTKFKKIDKIAPVSKISKNKKIKVKKNTKKAVNI